MDGSIMAMRMWIHQWVNLKCVKYAEDSSRVYTCGVPCVSASWGRERLFLLFINSSWERKAQYKNISNYTIQFFLAHWNLCTGKITSKCHWQWFLFGTCPFNYLFFGAHILHFPYLIFYTPFLHYHPPAFLHECLAWREEPWRQLVRCWWHSF